MLLVKAEARRSPIHGLGLFAVESIKKGTPVARWTEGHDMRMTPTEWAALPARVREWLYVHWWTREDGNWYGTCDDGRFTNHSKTPNMLWDDATKTSIAARDIAAGEELTEDYGDFDSAFAEYAADLAAAPQLSVPAESPPWVCPGCGVTRSLAQAGPASEWDAHDWAAYVRWVCDRPPSWPCRCGNTKAAHEHSLIASLPGKCGAAGCICPRFEPEYEGRVAALPGHLQARAGFGPDVDGTDQVSPGLSAPTVPAEPIDLLATLKKSLAVPPSTPAPTAATRECATCGEPLVPYRTCINPDCVPAATADVPGPTAFDREMASAEKWLPGNHPLNLCPRCNGKGGFGPGDRNVCSGCGGTGRSPGGAGK